MNQQDCAPDPRKNAEYERCFREEVEAAPAEADHRITESIPDDEAEQEMDELKLKFLPSAITTNR